LTSQEKTAIFDLVSTLKPALKELFGAEGLRHILNEQQKFDVIVPDEAFEHDLKYKNAVCCSTLSLRGVRGRIAPHGHIISKSSRSRPRSGILPPLKSRLHG